MGLTYTVDPVDVMVARALNPSWNKKMDMAVTAGRKTEFLRAENAKAALQIMTQRERFRSEFPNLAKEADRWKDSPR